MKMLTIALLSLCLMLQGNQKEGQRSDHTIRIGTAEVALDVVVRDKKGRPVKDLTVEDFEVLEDGARQKIESFRLVSRDIPGRPAVTDKPAAAASADFRSTNETNPNLVAIVFDRLSPDARNLARKASGTYANEGFAAGDFTGVFVIDLSLKTLQNYTDNPELIRKALDDATAMSTSQFASNNQQTRALGERVTSLNRQIDAGAGAAASAGAGRDAGGASAAGEAIGVAASQAALLQMQERMLATFEMLERDQQGYATINGLLAVITSMRNLPGRKTIIFFSEGLALPPAVMVKFPSVINAANRAGVSIYSIDSAGLRIDSPNAEATREINAAAARRMEQVHSSRDNNTGPMMRNLERNEDLLRLNPHSGLGDLADQTGGFLIRDTNDLSAGLRKIDEDIRVHYLVTYAPKSQVYDGRFRQIEVKLKRGGLDVQTRKGYYAIEPAGASPVLEYEVPALAALGAGGRANPFQLRTSALTFPESKRPGLTAVLAEVPLSAVHFAVDKEKKLYDADLSIVALLRDESGQVALKMSQRYPLNGPASNLEAASKGEVLFYREAELPPGKYKLEVAAYDGLTKKASVAGSTIEIAPPNPSRPRMSSVALLKRADRLSEQEKKQDNPFHVGEVIVYPNLGEPIRKAVTKQLAFFFTAWPASDSKEKMAMTIEILQGGRSIGKIAGDLPQPDESGRIKYASAIPLERFTPGNYELKVTVQQGANSTASAAPFTIE